MTLSITTLRIITFSINNIQHNNPQYNNIQHTTYTMLTFSITTISINNTQHNNILYRVSLCEWHYGQSCVLQVMLCCGANVLSYLGRCYTNRNDPIGVSSPKSRNSYWSERLSTVDLLIKIGCFVKMEKYSFSLKSIWSKLVRTRRSTVLILPLQ